MATVLQGTRNSVCVGNYECLNKSERCECVTARVWMAPLRTQFALIALTPSERLLLMSNMEERLSANNYDRLLSVTLGPIALFILER